ncbi:MAG: hypothetical protein HY858_16960 [Candidatus Solibacter usitatus]|nr:hypothetical protein [Candidatus Solibacter usitatus]
MRLTTPYRWFVGVAPDHSLQYADGLLQLLVDDKSQVVATARYVTLKDPTDGPRAAAFLASLLGIRVHALPSEGVCVCPGTACWISEERDPMRLFFQHGPLLVFVSAYDRSAWDETGGGAGPSVKERVLHDIAETLAAKAAQ